MMRSALFRTFFAALAALPLAVAAQTPTPPASAPPAASAPATKSGPPTPCERAKQHVADQKRSMDRRAEQVTEQKKERESCKSPDGCKKLDKLIEVYARGRANDEKKLARYEADAEAACKGS